MAYNFRGNKKVRVPKTVKKTVITIVLLLAWSGVAGAAYVYYTGRNTNVKEAAAPDVPAEVKAVKEPVKPAENVGVGVSVASLLTPTIVGDNTSLSINTRPEAKCTPTVTYAGKPSTDTGLAPKTANAYGSVSWTWTIEKTVPLGKHPIRVVCAYKDKTGVVQTEIEVVKS